MSKKFIISTDPLSGEQEAAFQAKLSTVALWWHWLPNFWLAVDKTGTLSTVIIREMLQQVSLQHRCMIFEVVPKYWSGLVRPDIAGTKMEQWIIDHWDGEKP